MKKRLVPTSTAAIALRLKPATIRKMIERGHFTRYGTQKRALVDLAECEAWLTGSRRKTAK